MYFFWEKLSFIFRLKNKIIFWGKRNIIFLDSATRNIIFQCNIFGNTIFWEHLKKVSYFHVFFLRKIIFHFHLKNKTIFLGKRNIIFPDNTRKIILQRNFFGKTIFSEHLEKENVVFHAVNTAVVIAGASDLSYAYIHSIFTLLFDKTFLWKN